jgi:Tol biopolymer transport system component
MLNKRIGSLFPTLAFLASAITSSALAQQREAEVALQQAMHVEQVEGNLERAIQLYTELVDTHAAARDVAAKAQLHIGMCLEKLGLTEARQAYRDVVDNFPEQRDAVAAAQQRLASLAEQLAELTRQPTFTKIEIASNPQNGVLSPDGSRLAFVSDGGVWVMPIHGNVSPDIAGAPVRIAGVEGAWDAGGSLLAWSGDGRWIAVNGRAGDEDVVYVVPTAGGEPRLVRTPTRGPLDASHRLSLSPEGGTLAFSALGQDQDLDLSDTQSQVIYSVPVSGGEPRQLTSMPGILPAFSPDGETIAYVSRREGAQGGFEGDLWLVPASGGEPIRIISSDSGRIGGPVWSPTGDFIASRHIPGGNNFSAELWVIPVNSTDPGSPMIKISLPKASWRMVTGWTPDNELGVFMRTPASNVGATAFGVFTVPASGGRAAQVSDEGIPEDLAWSPDETQIFTLWVPDRGDSVPTGAEGMIGYVPAGGGKLRALPVAWGRDINAGIGLDVSPDGENVVFTGGLFSMARGRPGPEDVNIWTASVDSGALTQLTAAPEFDAFPCWSPDGKWIAFLRLEEEFGYDAGNIQLIAPAGGEIRQITSNADTVGVASIAFSPDGSRIAYFSGSAIKTVPIEGGRSEVLLEDEFRGSFPDLAWSPDGRHIAYTTARGGKIKLASLDTGRSVELETGLSPETMYSAVTLSPDGATIAFVAAQPTDDEFWLISDFLPQQR